MLRSDINFLHACAYRRSSMILGRSSPAKYDARLNLNPGTISSVIAAPPRTCLRSNTSTSNPARARYAADVRALWPPPTMTTSRAREVAARMPDDAICKREFVVWGLEPKLLYPEARYCPLKWTNGDRTKHKDSRQINTGLFLTIGLWGAFTHWSVDFSSKSQQTK